MEVSGVLKYCLQMNSIACANERIPRRARKSAFLGIVHFAHCCTFLNGHSFLKTLHIIFYTLAGNSLLPRWCTQKVFRIKTFRIKIVKKQRHSDGGKFSLLYFCFLMFCILA
jgi:hypothetical protein